MRLSWYGVLVALQVLLLLLCVWLLRGVFERWVNAPMEEVRVSGTLHQVAGESIQRRLMAYAGTPYIELPLAAIRAELESDPWIDRVDLHRRWPQTLAVEVHENRPVARWGERGLVNERGVVFEPPQVAGFERLPLLRGGQGQALEMMRQYRNFTQLLRPLGLKVTALSMEARGAWTLTLDNGIELRVGRGKTLERMERFTRIYTAQLEDYVDRIRAVDVRYTNGLTVTWNEPPRRLDAAK